MSLMSWMIGSALAAEPDWRELLNDAVWASDGMAATDEGEVRLWHAVLGGISCGRAEILTPLPTQQLLSTLADIDHSERWASVSRSDRLPGGDREHYDYVQVMEAPGWTLAADRFWISRAAIERQGERTILHWTRIPAGQHDDVRARILETNPEAIELPAQVGAWTFERHDDATVVRYAACTDPGGALPQNLQSWATRRSMPQHLAALVRAATPTTAQD